jgi:hypothetical protein
MAPCANKFAPTLVNISAILPKPLFFKEEPLIEISPNPSFSKRGFYYQYASFSRNRSILLQHQCTGSRQQAKIQYGTALARK